MKKIYNHLLLLPLIFTSAAASAKDENTKQNKTIIEALKNGTPSLDMRYRYEFVDQKNLDNANASTLRTALGYKTGEFKNVSGFIEFENISEIGERRYNDTVNGRSNYATVADPKGTEINQAYINWKAPAKTNTKLGRQEIKLDNERFIGAVAWRQNHQSMDGALISNDYFKDFNFTYAFVSRVNRIFGPDSTVGILDSNNINLFNISYKGLKNTKIIAYDYLLDIKDPITTSGTYSVNGATSSKTAGVDFHVRLGDKIHKGEKLFTIHSNSPGELEYVLNYLHKGIKIIDIKQF